MNIGFRPRLKARPSLYDLIRNRNIEDLSVRRRPSFAEELPELPPLPPSPSPTRSPPPTLRTYSSLQQQIEYPEVVTMPPKKAAIKDDDNEQYGMLINQAICQFQLTQLCRLRLFGLWVCEYVNRYEERY